MLVTHAVILFLCLADYVVFACDHLDKGQRFLVGVVTQDQENYDDPVHIEVLHSATGTEYSQYQATKNWQKRDMWKIPNDSIYALIPVLTPKGDIPAKYRDQIEESVTKAALLQKAQKKHNRPQPPQASHSGVQPMQP